MTNRTFLITGAAGFVGHHVVEHLLKNTNDKIIGVDSLTYAGTWDRLRHVEIYRGDYDREYISAFEHPNFTSLGWDFTKPAGDNLVKELQDVTHILHLGAESHVDHSIEDPQRFVDANITGTVNVMQLARQLPNLRVMNLFSTDEVFGPAPLYTKDDDTSLAFEDSGYEGFKETDRHNPKNPYAATKSAAEMMAIAFANTYKLPIFVTNGMNIIGERQHPEKFLGICINKTLQGGKISIHGTSDKTQAGKRTYIHARNVADALMFLVDNEPFKQAVAEGEVESYNIVGEQEMDNLSFAKLISESTSIEASALKQPITTGVEFEIVDFHSSRPGHDLRYALDGQKMKDLGWVPPKTLQQSLRKTVKWYLENPQWLEMK